MAPVDWLTESGAAERERRCFLSTREQRIFVWLAGEADRVGGLMQNGKARILLVDDEQGVIKMVGKRLETAGFDLVTALDGEAALERAHADHPDLIVLDLMLPKLSGLKVCLALKHEEPFRHIPVIIFTGKDQEVDRSVCVESGADSYVPKALGANVLITEIKTLLAKSHANLNHPASS